MAEQRYQEKLNAGENYAQWFVISTAPGALDLDYCNTIKTQYGLTMPVLIDPDGLLRGAMGHSSLNDWNYVLDDGAEISLRSQYSSQNGVVAPAIDAALAD